MAASGNELVTLSQLKTAMDANASDIDLSGYALKEDGYIRVDENNNLVRFDNISGTETNVANFNIKTNASALGNIEIAPQAGIKVAANAPLEMSVTSGDGGYAKLTSVYDGTASISTNGRLVIKDKTVTSITDDASSGSSTALVTAKAVKDYISTSSNQDFCTFMGIEYDAADWT